MPVENLIEQIRTRAEICLSKLTEEEAQDFLNETEARVTELQNDLNSDVSWRLRQLRTLMEGWVPRSLSTPTHEDVTLTSPPDLPKKKTLSQERVNEIVPRVDNLALKLAGRDIPTPPPMNKAP
jgi:hypothetical protein